MFAHIDAFHWWGPVGWAWRNGVWGNTAASLLWAGPPFLLGAKWGKRRAEKADAHSHWMATHLARVHVAATGTPPDPHPHHGLLTGAADEV